MRSLNRSGVVDQIIGLAGYSVLDFGVTFEKTVAEKHVFLIHRAGNFFNGIFAFFYRSVISKSGQNRAAGVDFKFFGSVKVSFSDMGTKLPILLYQPTDLFNTGWNGHSDGIFN